MNKIVSILGSTGSIGTQTLDIVRMHNIKVSALAAYKNIRLLEQQAREFNPEYVCIVDKESSKHLKLALADTNIKVVSGTDGLNQIAAESKCDIVLNSIVGIAGLVPTILAINSGKDIALANKEALVTGGSIVMKAVKENNVQLYPVDSEHSAIFQCLQSCDNNDLKKIILTASGGAFWGKTKKELENVTVADALKHPNWNMGKKITIDSATMMNKGLEIIEASWLFNIPENDIDVLIHRESIIHSMIQLKDNAIIAQLGLPDMRIPIQYALTYPNHLSSPAKELDLNNISNLSFYQPDYETFECLKICREVLKKGGLYPTIANAANEVAVDLFLKNKISFLQIPKIVKNAVEEYKFNENSNTVTLDDILEADNTVRLQLQNKFKFILGDD